MPGGMRNNSIMDDPVPYRPPEPKKTPKPKQVESEQQKIRKDPKYPELAKKIAIMKEKHRIALPGGTLVENTDKTNEQLGEAWKVAAQVLAELDELETWLQQNMGMVVIK